MGITYITPLDSPPRYINVNFAGLHRELKNQGGEVVHIGEAEGSAELWVIRDHRIYYENPAYIKKIKQLEGPKALLVGDLHTTQLVTYQKRVQIIKNFVKVLSPYAGHPMADFYKLNVPQVPWFEFPWWFDQTVFYPPQFVSDNQDRPVDIAFIGCRKPLYVYPLRNLMYEHLKQTGYNVKAPEHPGYQHPGGCTGMDYADLLRRAKILLFGNSVYGYPLFKYFEGLACGCKVLAPRIIGKCTAINNDLFTEINSNTFEAQIMIDLETPQSNWEVYGEPLKNWRRLNDARARARQLSYFIE